MMHHCPEEFCLALSKYVHPYSMLLGLLLTASLTGAMLSLAIFGVAWRNGFTLCGTQTQFLHGLPMLTSSLSPYLRFLGLNECSVTGALWGSFLSPLSSARSSSEWPHGP